MNIYYISASATLTFIYLILYWIAGMIDPGIMKRNLDCYGASQLPVKVVHKGVYKTTKICQCYCWKYGRLCEICTISEHTTITIVC